MKCYHSSPAIADKFSVLRDCLRGFGSFVRFTSTNTAKPIQVNSLARDTVFIVFIVLFETLQLTVILLPAIGTVNYIVELDKTTIQVDIVPLNANLQKKRIVFMFFLRITNISFILCNKTRFNI